MEAAGLPAWEQTLGASREAYCEDIRQTLTELRDAVTEEMLAKICVQLCCQGDCAMPTICQAAVLKGPNVMRVFTATIDAALSEGK